MTPSGYDILLDMLSNFQVQYNNISALVNHNDLKISELETYIKKFTEKEDSGFQVFSPRSDSSAIQIEIQKSKAEIAELENQNAQNIQKMQELQAQITNLEAVLDNEKKNEEENDSEEYDSFSNKSMLSMQEKERQRIARDLHDTSLQNLAYIIHKIELAGIYIDRDPIRAKLELSVVSKNLREIIDELRNIIYDLRPMSFDDLGLKASFERLLTKVNENKKYIIDIDIEDVSCENKLFLLTIYRIVQECIYNIVKHANADRILFHCKKKNNIYCIRIEDNGTGFAIEELDNKKNKHFGISLMKERVDLLGGTISMQSKKDKGTRIQIDIPMDDADVVD